MPTSRPSSLYISNWSLAEPLCASQTLPYLRGLALRGHPSCLVTFERAPYALSAADADRTRFTLAADGICWHPLTYHRRSNGAAALYDGVRVLIVAARALLNHRPQIVHTRTSVPAPLGWLLAGLTRRRFLYDADSELSEEYADGGYWDRRGWRFRLLAALEDICRRRADAIIVLSERLRNDFASRGVRAPITVIPCCVDTRRFRFSETDRIARREELGLTPEDKLLVYAGKTGPRYLVDETMKFVAALEQRLPVRLLVLTHDDPGAFQAAAARQGVGSPLIIRRAAPAEVPSWLSAADAGLGLIRTVPSESGSSPIKMSEYLACGLPVITTPGIGDQSAAIDGIGLGVVIGDETDAARVAAVARLEALWVDKHLRARCESHARATLDVEFVGVTRYADVYEALSNTGIEVASAAPGSVR